MMDIPKWIKMDFTEQNEAQKDKTEKPCKTDGSYFFLVCWQRKALSLNYKFVINIEEIGVGWWVF